MERKPIFTIIIPVYNSEKYIKKCLDSIEKQQFSDFEIICVNDGSTDDSLEILIEHQKKNKRTKILNVPHKNAGVARNEGIGEALGDYLVFLDADDYLLPNALINISKKIKENNNPDIIIFKSKEKNEINKTIRKNKNSLIETNCPEKDIFTPQEIKEKIFNSFNYWTWNKVYKTSFIKNNEIIFQDINRSNDVMFVSESLVKAKAISIINKYLIIHRVGHGTNMQANNANEPITFWFAFLETQKKLKNILNEEYTYYERSFLNSVLKAFRDYLYSVAYNSKVYEFVKSYIKDNAENDFGFLSHDKDYYNEEEYEWYINIMNNTERQEIKKSPFTEKIAKLKRSIEDNGIKYTINRILFHMKLREDNDPLRTYNTKK